VRPRVDTDEGAARDRRHPREIEVLYLRRLGEAIQPHTSLPYSVAGMVRPRAAASHHVQQLPAYPAKLCLNGGRVGQTVPSCDRIRFDCLDNGRFSIHPYPTNAKPARSHRSIRR
jgi:hypothetical protein